MTRNLAATSLVTVCLFFPSTASAQGRAEEEVRTTIEAFLKDLGSHNVDALPGYLAPGAVLIVARNRNRSFNNSITSSKEWLEQMRTNANPDPFVDRLSNVEVTIDADQIAYLRADFEIVRNQKVVSSGVDVFTLIRSGNEWKIAAIAYTSIPTPPLR